MAGGQEFAMPSFEDAVPKSQQPAKGGLAAVPYTDENTWSGASEREARMDMNSVQAVDQRLRGYRPEPVGGTYNPGHGGAGRQTSSSMQSGPTEVAPGNNVG